MLCGENVSRFVFINFYVCVLFKVMFQNWSLSTDYMSICVFQEFNVNMKSPSPNTKPKEKRKDDRNGVPIIG